MSDANEELGQPVDPVDESGIDDEKDLIADENRDDDPSGVDRATQDWSEVVPAEEAAMHIEDERPNLPL